MGAEGGGPRAVGIRAAQVGADGSEATDELGDALVARAEGVRSPCGRGASVGIVNDVLQGEMNVTAENLNAKIRKKTACGYRNWDRFRMAIPFHRGGLDV